MSETKVMISSVETGRAYLARVPMENPVEAGQQLLDLLEALIASPCELSVFVPILELMRAPLGQVEEAIAHRYQNKSVPLADEEEGWFGKSLFAWEHMAEAYGQCIKVIASYKDNPEHRPLAAMLLQRQLYYIGKVIFEHYRARRDLPEGLWVKFHAAYETAERWGLANTPVEDSLENSLQSTHCTAAYVSMLLIEMASPYSNTVRDLNLTRRLALMWGNLVSVLPLNDDLEVPPYIVEFGRDMALHSPGQNDGPANDVRYLDTMRIGPQIHHMISQLKQRMSPAELGLGQEISAHCIRLLDRLSRPWQQQASPRRFRRFNSHGKARIAQGFPAMHHYISGGEFFQPDAEAVYSRGDFDRLFTFSERVDRGSGSGMAIEPHPDFPIDDWDVINHSANGFRLSRSCAGQRITHGALLAICPHDGENFLLAKVTWLMQEREGGLVVGLSILPGIPDAVAVRYMGVGMENRANYVRAFLLPAVPAIHEEASIILPSGMYQGGRVIEIHDGEAQTVEMRMRDIVMHGNEFDRIVFDSV